MKPSSAVLAWFILISDIFASASSWKEKARNKIDLQPSYMFVKCGRAEYTSAEIDKAANEACYLKFTKGKILGIPLMSQPKAYQGDKVITFNEESESSHHLKNYKYHHSTHVLNFEPNPLLMWRLKNKFRHLNAKCYAIIKWTPERVKCKAIAVIMREKGREDVKCTQLTIRDSTSKHAASPLYHPKNPSLHHPEDPLPPDDLIRKSNSVHGTTSVPPFNSNFLETTKDIGRDPSFKIYTENNEITELED